MGAELSLPVLAGVISVGIPVLLALVHATGGSQHVRLDVDVVTRLLMEEDPTAELDLLHVEEAGHQALMRTKDGRRFVVWSMESSGAVRALPSKGAVALEGDRLVVRLGDPSWPARSIRLAEHQRATWVEGEGHAS